MKTIDILAKFLAKDDVSYYMNSPILRGEFIFATNGHAMVRVPKCDGIAVGDGAGPKNIEVLMGDTVRAGLVQIGDLPVPKQCDFCHGKWTAYRCKDCDGEGEFYHKDEAYDCKPCGGCGTFPDGDESDKVVCWACDGDGHKQQRVAVGCADFDRRYLAKIKELPGAMFAPHPTDSNKPAYFTFDGGDGALMPMTKLDEVPA